MRRLPLWVPALLTAAVTGGLLTLGCSKPETPKADNKPQPGDNVSKKERGKKGKKEGPKPIVATAWGTLVGKVTLDGAPPTDLDQRNKDILEKMEKQDAAHCVKNVKPDDKDQLEQQNWRISKDGGVQNVFVWLKAPKGSYFKVDMTKKSWPDEVDIDQPHCAFIPHAVVLFPSFYDPDTKEQKSTGQKFVVKNSSDIAHNTKWAGGDNNPGKNETIPPKESRTYPVQADDSPIQFQCNIHGWMNAYARAFDHPYAAVTDKDGNFEIKNVPAGVELAIVAWHESAGYLNGPEGVKATFKGDTQNTQDFKVKAK